MQWEHSHWLYVRRACTIGFLLLWRLFGTGMEDILLASNQLLSLNAHFAPAQRGVSVRIAVAHGGYASVCRL